MVQGGIGFLTDMASRKETGIFQCDEKLFRMRTPLCEVQQTQETIDQPYSGEGRDHAAHAVDGFVAKFWEEVTHASTSRFRLSVNLG